MSSRWAILFLICVGLALAVFGGAFHRFDPVDARQAQLKQECAELNAIENRIEADGRDLAAQHQALVYLQAQINETDHETRPAVPPK